MKFLVVFLLAQGAFARAPVRECNLLFPESKHIEFSHQDIQDMFYTEYQKISKKPQQLNPADVKSMSNLSELLALNDFVFEPQFLGELKLSDQYARMLLSVQEKLLFLPVYSGVYVPGFDGIIYSKDGTPIANVSLKSSLGDWRYSLEEAFQKARFYSKNEEQWFKILVGRDFYGEDRPFLFRVSTWGRYYKYTFKKVVLLMHLLGVPVSCEHCPVRKTRVVIEFPRRDSELSKQAVKYVQWKMREYRDYIESTTFIGRDGNALTIYPDRVRRYEK